MTRKLSIALAFVAFSGASFAISFDALDADGDGSFGRDQFMDSGLFQCWDKDSDGRLGKDEVANGWGWGQASDWDIDKNDYLNRTEFYENAWDDWDEDLDGNLSREEFEAEQEWWNCQSSP